MSGDTGISTSYKVPRYVAKIMFAGGRASAGSQRLRCLLIGMKTSAGTMTADAAPIRCTSPDEANTLAGVGSQLARMCYAALQNPSIELWICAVTEPSGGTKATVTILIGGTWTTPGVLRWRLGGVRIACDVAATSAIDDVGAAIVTAFNAKQQLAATGTYDTDTDTVTLTINNKGASGKDHILYSDPTDRPVGLTLGHTGSAAVNVTGVRFGASSTGTGAEDVTTLLTKLTKSRWARIACGPNDATNAALLEAHVNSKAGPLSLLLDQLIFAHNGTKAQAKSLGQTTLNAFRAQCLWFRNSENHPSEVAAIVAGRRSTWEQGNPVPDYDGDPFEYLKGQEFEDDLPSDPEQDEVLNAGVTPMTTSGGVARVVRAICTYCVSNGVQDERCLDIGDVVMTDFATLDLKVLYDTEFRPQNPIVHPDPAPEEEAPQSGIAFPKLWNAKECERLTFYKKQGWTVYLPTGKWAPISTYNEAGGFIATETPLPISRVQHRMDNVMRQIATVG